MADKILSSSKDEKSSTERSRLTRRPTPHYSPRTLPVAQRERSTSSVKGTRSFRRGTVSSSVRKPRSWELIPPSEGWMCDADDEKEIGGMDPSEKGQSSEEDPEMEEEDPEEAGNPKDRVPATPSLPMDIDAEDDFQRYIEEMGRAPEPSPLRSSQASYPISQCRQLTDRPLVVMVRAIICPEFGSLSHRVQVLRAGRIHYGSVSKVSRDFQASRQPSTTQNTRHGNCFENANRLTFLSTFPKKSLRLSKTVHFHFHFQQNQIIFILQQKNIIEEKPQRSTRTKRLSPRFEHEEEEFNNTHELTNLRNRKELQPNSKNQLRRTQQLKLFAPTFCAHHWWLYVLNVEKKHLFVLNSKNVVSPSPERTQMGRFGVSNKVYHCISGSYMLFFPVRRYNQFLFLAEQHIGSTLEIGRKAIYVEERADLFVANVYQHPLAAKRV
ncbi:hypothetical protein PIB30_081164 [Stylosanthes scabra]|uniref:Ubiquitin-like protease family profile domain-containing protein n=1 Tax=Stylosanthes scabra TaxID=79078 RepID=A0ABU6SRS5_9FABA|nr:hypothetical protein [Stylosanthes scabra]